MPFSSLDVAMFFTFDSTAEETGLTMALKVTTAEN